MLLEIQIGLMATYAMVVSWVLDTKHTIMTDAMEYADVKSPKYKGPELAGKFATTAVVNYESMTREIPQIGSILLWYLLSIVMLYTYRIVGLSELLALPTVMYTTYRFAR